jgi:ribosomal protein L1
VSANCWRIAESVYGEEQDAETGSNATAVPSVRQSVRDVIQGSKDKKRNFVETIELQIGLKNYDVRLQAGELCYEQAY